MKRFFTFFLFSLYFLSLAIFQVFANTQRLGLSAGTESVVLSQKGSSNYRRAFCLDRHLLIGEPVTFTKVLAGDAKIVKVGNRPLMSLTQAIKGNFVKIEGSGRRYDGLGFSDSTQLKFISNADESVVINFPGVLAMGEGTANPIQPEVLQSLKNIKDFTNSDEPKFNPIEKVNFRKNQDDVWAAGINESRLELLGFYGTGIVIRNPQNTIEAIKKLQKRLGFRQPTGILNLKTKEGLEKLEQEEIVFFEEIGFGVNREDTNVKSLVDNIHLAERMLLIDKKDRTGKLSEELKQKVKEFISSNQDIIRQVINVEKTNLKPYEYPSNIDLNVNTFLKIPRILKLFSLFKELPDNHILISSAESFELWQLKDGLFYNRITDKDTIIRELNFLSVYSNYYLSAYLKNKNVLQFKVVKDGDKEVTLISPLVQNLTIQESKFNKFISGEESLPELDNLVDKIVSEQGMNSTLTVMRSLFSQNRVEMETNKFLRQFGYREIDAVKFAIAFNRKYGDKVKAVISTDILLGSDNLNKTPKVESGASITLYMDGKFKFSTKIIGEIKQELKDARLNIVSAGNKITKTPIVLFANHNDPDFRKEILEMAEQGLFKDSIIALAVCGTGCDTQFNSFLIKKSGARGVIFYNEKIKAQATQDVLKKFGELLQKKGAVTETDFQNLWRESVTEAQKEASSDDLKQEIRKLSDSIFQVSTVEKKESLEIVE